MEFIVCLDQNERHNDFSLLMKDCPAQIRRCSLPVGDIWILVRLPGEAKFRLFIVIERKARQDALKSTMDKRYQEQKLRLTSCCTIQHSRVVWLFEMTDKEWEQHAPQHYGMQASLFVHGIIPQRTSCAASTVEWLRSLVRKLQQHLDPEQVNAIPPLIDLLTKEMESVPEHASMYRPCIAVLLHLQGSPHQIQDKVDDNKKRKRYMDHVGPTRLIKGANSEPGGDYLNALAAVRGMSVEKARSVAAQFPSMVDFVTTGLDKEKLANISIQQSKGRTRRLGHVLADRLIRMAMEKVTPLT